MDKEKRTPVKSLTGRKKYARLRVEDQKALEKIPVKSKQELRLNTGFLSKTNLMSILILIPGKTFLLKFYGRGAAPF